MKNTNIMMTPLFAAVVVLLSVGAVGELFLSLFSKLKSKVSQTSSTTENALERATQLK